VILLLKAMLLLDSWTLPLLLELALSLEAGQDETGIPPSASQVIWVVSAQFTPTRQITLSAFRDDELLDNKTTLLLELDMPTMLEEFPALEEEVSGCCRGKSSISELVQLVSAIARTRIARIFMLLFCNIFLLFGRESTSS
jgi:hypothetical protein